jgi:hypothetical protein
MKKLDFFTPFVLLSFMPAGQNLINQAATVTVNVKRDPLYKKLSAMHLTLTTRRFLYYYLSNLELEEACGKAHITKGHAASILSDFSKRRELQEIMQLVGLDDVTVLGKMSQLLHAKRPVYFEGLGMKEVPALGIQAKVLDIATKVKGWQNGALVNVNVFSPVEASQTQDELNGLD